MYLYAYTQQHIHNSKLYRNVDCINFTTINNGWIMKNVRLEWKFRLTILLIYDNCTTINEHVSGYK